MNDNFAFIVGFGKDIIWKYSLWAFLLQKSPDSVAIAAGAWWHTTDDGTARKRGEQTISTRLSRQLLSSQNSPRNVTIVAVWRPLEIFTTIPPRSAFVKPPVKAIGHCRYCVCGRCQTSVPRCWEPLKSSRGKSIRVGGWALPRDAQLATDPPVSHVVFFFFFFKIIDLNVAAINIETGFASGSGCAATISQGRIIFLAQPTMHYSVVLYMSHSKIHVEQGFILDSSPQWHRTVRSALWLSPANKKTTFPSILNFLSIQLQSAFPMPCCSSSLYCKPCDSTRRTWCSTMVGYMVLAVDARAVILL